MRVLCVQYNVQFKEREMNVQTVEALLDAYLHLLRIMVVAQIWTASGLLSCLRWH
jgi:hypothetical protein